MKSEITSLDLHFLVRELQDLVGSKVDKIYEQDSQEEQKDAKKDNSERKDFLFVFHKTGSGKKMLRIKLPSLVYITETKQEFPENPPGFCMFLRKYIGSSRLIAIRQKGFERVLEMDFENKAGRLTLISELFSKGNMILIDGEYKIKGLLESQNWQSRVIRGGTKYEYPPVQNNPKEMTVEEIARVLKASQLDSTVKAVAIELSFGGLYAEEICRRAKVDKNSKPASHAKVVAESVKAIFQDSIFPNKLGDEILPIHANVTGKEVSPEKYETFSKALDDNFTDKIAGQKEQKKQKEANSKRSKIQIVIEKQQERLKELEDTAGQDQRRGELIYEHYNDITKLINMINEDRKKMDWPEIKKKYSQVKKIKHIDEKKGRVTLDLQ